MSIAASSPGLARVTPIGRRAATVDEILTQSRDPHELPAELHDLWRDGFHAGAAAMRAQRDQAEAAADYWYLRANHSATQIREMQLRAMDEGWRVYWRTGMPTEAVPE
ncbi:MULTISPECIES: hypothetical protein [unclassified Microbacterium]|uniref:hypothetical protein n=1 Tax=unclassified Microbacterium TaxID=2609290 RepID=UPI000C2BC4B2|nr:MULTISPECIES: hypothetical protein [unclassified Microbacterium]